jgi:hypothetical protein
MISVVAFILLAFNINLPPVQNTETAKSSTTQPSLVDVPKDPNGLTLYNEKGEVVARCRKKGQTFRDCKMESGVTLDDLMNAWVHAYLDVQR